MFSNILIANRGEIALRIVRACRELGIHSVVAYSQADERTLAVELADEAICIGPPPASSSYLLVERLIAAAEVCNVDAIHPGYGFLAENPHFAEVCGQCNITFIGPSPAAIRRMGNKAEARKTAAAANVPIIPGSPDIVDTDVKALALAREMGYPVMVKASAGGGGKGMRVVHNDGSLVQNFHAARIEAEKAFGLADVYIEKLIERPRHVEIQLIGDKHGNVVHLGERDCSLQRRHQKLIEESPCPVLDPELRAEMGAAAVRVAKTVGYATAGTVEFLLGADRSYYFMEMNTRIQVEHPVTEMVTGIDLVREQILTAAGAPLSFTQDDVQLKGHAIEIRINAEDAHRNFAPCPGTIEFYGVPGGPGVRVDSHAYSGYTIPPYYDSMIGKLIVHAPDRAQAIVRARRALGEFLIHGVTTTVDFAGTVLDMEPFRSGQYDTGTLERWLESTRS
jgi:acetyl-CoA carboxylase biotin carboxylase subunit